MSLAPVAAPWRKRSAARSRFADDCIGEVAEAAVAKLKDGEVLLLENTRFHAGEEKNDPDWPNSWPKLGDIFVNDAFSAAHRAHASTEGVARICCPMRPAARCRPNCSHLEKALSNPERPLLAVVGGAKVSSKIALLGKHGGAGRDFGDRRGDGQHLSAAEGIAVGKSLYEPDHLDTARKVIHWRRKAARDILLPIDVVVAKEFRAGAPHRTVPAAEIARGRDGAGCGARKTITAFEKRLAATKTLVWNGPFGAFETTPFDAGTVAAARAVAARHPGRAIVAVAGGGDTVAALAHAGVEEDFTYVSTAGGAFLEWLEGKELPGVEALAERGPKRER